MALDVNDVAGDIRFFKRKFRNIEKHGQPENPSICFLKEELKEQIINHMEYADSDYVKYLRGGYKSIPDDPQHELFIEDAGDDPQHELSVEDVGDDPQYELFLSSLKTHGSSYMLQVDEKVGLTKPLKYEEDESDDEGQEDLDSLSKTQWRESKIDDDYALFQDNLDLEGSNVIYQCDNGLPLVYDSLNVPNLQTDNHTSSRKRKSKLLVHKEKSSDSSEEDRNSQCSSPRRKTRSTFRVRIMRILSKPYDKEEHEELMQAITLQKAETRHVDLRSGNPCFYASNKKGKSYLDHHADLKRKVQTAAKDDRTQLNLLRGFFFWIQNLTQEGSFIPWNDKECLAVQPQAC